MFDRVILPFVFIALAFSAAFSQTPPAPEIPLIKLGTIEVSPGTKSNRTDLSAAKGRSSAVQLRMASGTVTLSRIAVQYSNGQVFTDDAERKLNPKDRTKLVAERPEARFIDSVEIAYPDTALPTAPAVLEVWARQTAQDAEATRGAELPSTGAEQMEQIAVPTLSLLLDRDVITLAAPKAVGGRIRFHAVDHDIWIVSAVVVSVSGLSQTVDVNANLKKGDLSPWIPVSEEGIREIRLNYRPQPAQGGTATVEIYGGATVVSRSTDEPAEPEKPFVAVPVFYGTDRARGVDLVKAGRKIAVYTNESQKDMALGMAVVTVPTRKDRERGAITRPGWNLLFTTIAFRDEDMALDFTIDSVEELSEDAFVAKAKERIASAKDFKDQAFVFIHGYNVVFDDALFRTAQISYDTGFDGGAFLYSWPSSGKFLGYAHDLKRVDVAREHLIEFLDIVRKKTGATKVHLMAHSMGGELLTDTLREIAATGQAGTTTPPFGEIILASPDVTRDSFENRAKRIAHLGTGITLYASEKDLALRVSNQVALGEMPAGFIPRAGVPIIVPGIDSIDASAVSTDVFSLNHSEFADRSQLLDDIARIFKTGTHPPKLRYEPFEEIAGRAGKYWKYPKLAP
ncbi:alpha/beta fold hydrolase [uncultured Hyphomicrobium sp.]|uniref:alpha/beta hydrolase n=1 Tax=uncultured Hyphomicrobium sp. TaxID=194373 RepID=UPI0025F70487|nr:alpha/beta fold hydrolase [uncultured Hyphomicrobium sp.]